MRGSSKLRLLKSIGFITRSGGYEEKSGLTVFLFVEKRHLPLTVFAVRPAVHPEVVVVDSPTPNGRCRGLGQLALNDERKGISIRGFCPSVCTSARNALKTSYTGVGHLKV